MPLAMNREVFITCAVTGSGGTQDRSPHVPRSPKQIADAAIDAAKAGAAIVHCHVRDPETGKPRRDVHLYREVTERIRDAEVDVVLNLTAGMGGDMVFGDVENPLPLKAQGTDMGGASDRMEHIRQCLPEICTLDCGTMNFNEADYVMTNTPGMLRAMGAHDDRARRQAGDRGVRHRPSVVRQTAGGGGGAEARRAGSALHGRALGRAERSQHIHGHGQQCADDWTWSAFTLGRDQMAYVAAAVLAGGNVRVGLEDNLWLGKGVLATNAQLVERAVTIVENMGARVIGPGEVRKKLNLTRQARLSP